MSPSTHGPGPQERHRGRRASDVVATRSGPVFVDRDELDADDLVPLWRAAQAFRLASLVYALAVQWTVREEYDHVLVSWAIVAVMVVWSGAAGSVLAFGAARWRPRIVLTEQVLTLLLVSATLLVGPMEYFRAHQSVPTSFWATNAVVSAAILAGPWWGLVSALVVGLTALGVVDQYHLLRTDATLPILCTVGLAVGVGSQVVRRARERVRAAIRLEAAAAERERISREVHDTTLQVLAYVQKEGRRIGGETLHLAQLAGEQEAQLRGLLSKQATTAPTGPADLTQALSDALPGDVTVAGPGDPVRVQPAAQREIVAAVLAAHDNTLRHAGDGARTHVFVEDLPDEVVVTVRDDGVGMEPERPDLARAEGRMGISGSIVGRMEAIGGSAECFTEPGEGTEWELHHPKETR